MNLVRTYASEREGGRLAKSLRGSEAKNEEKTRGSGVNGLQNLSRLSTTNLGCIRMWGGEGDYWKAGFLSQAELQRKEKKRENLTKTSSSTGEHKESAKGREIRATLTFKDRLPQKT